MTDAGKPGDVAASIVEMQALLLGTETIQEFLAELAGLAILTVGEGLSCGITLQPNGRPLTVASTDALAAQVDEVQYGRRRRTATSNSGYSLPRSSRASVGSHPSRPPSTHPADAPRPGPRAKCLEPTVI